MKFLVVFQRIVYSVVQWGRRHIIILCSCALGLFAGFWGILVGFLTGFFIETLITRIRKDKDLEATLENPFGSSSTTGLMAGGTINSIGDEPFDGALLVCALVVYCTGNPEFAGQQMKFHFGDRYEADWVSLCRIVSRTESLNGDLITECLAARFVKVGSVNLSLTDDELLQGIFNLLSAVQYEWNYDRGEKPSVYLLELLHNPLLHNKKQVDEITAACLMLGVSVHDNLETVKAAHRSLVALYHPDTLGDLSVEKQKIAAETFLRIQAAYESIIEYPSSERGTICN